MLRSIHENVDLLVVLFVVAGAGTTVTPMLQVAPAGRICIQGAAIRARVDIIVQLAQPRSRRVPQATIVLQPPRNIPAQAGKPRLSIAILSVMRDSRSGGHVEPHALGTITRVTEVLYVCTRTEGFTEILTSELGFRILYLTH